MTKTTLLQSKVFNVFEPSSLVSKIYLSFIVLGSFLILLGGCSSSKIYHHRIPSEDALENISRFHIDRFEGVQSGFFREILIYEFNRLSYLSLIHI